MNDKELRDLKDKDNIKTDQTKKSWHHVTSGLGVNIALEKDMVSVTFTL